ncbi:MAG: hypothetical protein JXQ72_15295 [Anaerolineae bacterium]|nr:hypothetical protein [Anaerolineae bacterium]
MADNRATEVQRFRAAQRAARLHLLTVITPFRASLDRFMVIEGEAGATLRRCTGCRLSAPLDQGESQPVAPETLDVFLHGIESARAAWDQDALPDDTLDGVTIIAERATGDGYAITHMLAPRSNSPHARLLRAWAEAFPAVEKVLG